MSTVTLMPEGANIFESGALALVSPVDCSGVQGKGLALEFARRFRQPCADYKLFARRGRHLPGNVFVSRYVNRLIFFVATKRHWREESELGYIVAGANNLCVEVVARLNSVRSIAIPALGCGLGQLPWDDVRPLLLQAGERMAAAGVRVLIYPPGPPATRKAVAK